MIITDYKLMLKFAARQKLKTMRFFFYNSYSQGKGFKILEKPFNSDNLVEPSLVPFEISNDFLNGGVTLSLSPTSDFSKSYLLVKGIEEENKNKKFDEPGRKVFINFAILADIKEYNVLTHLCASMLLNWNNFCNYLLEVFTVDFSDSFGYTINTDKWNKVITYLSTFDTSFYTNSLLKSIEANNQIDRARLVIFSRDKKYYDDQAEMLNEMANSKSSSLVISTVIEDDDFESITEGGVSEKYENFKMQLENRINSDTDETNIDKTEKEDDSVESSSCLTQYFHPLWIVVAFFIGILIGLIIGYLL